MVFATLLFSLGLANAADAMAFPGQAPLADLEHDTSKLVNLTIRQIYCDSQWNGKKKCIGKWHREVGQVETKQSCNCCRNTTEFCDHCADQPAVITASYPKGGCEFGEWPCALTTEQKTGPAASKLFFDDGGHFAKQAKEFGLKNEDITWNFEDAGDKDGLVGSRANGVKIWMENEDNFVSFYSQFPTEWRYHTDLPVDLMWTQPTLTADKALGGTKPFTRCLHQRGRLEVGILMNVEKWFHVQLADGKWEWVPSTEIVTANLTITGVPGPSRGELPGWADQNQEYTKCQYVTPPNPHAICLLD